VRSAPTRLRLRPAAAALLALALAACTPSDPVAAVRAQQRAGDFAGSLPPLRELLEERPDDAEVHFLYGRALAATGQPSLAEWPLRKAMEDPDWLVGAGLQLAMGAYRTNNYPEAVDVAGRVLEADPDNVSALQIRANAFAHGRLEPEKALEDVDRILELDPDSVEALEPRIVALLELDRIEEATEAIEDLGARIEETELGPDVEAWHCATTALFADESGESELAAERWADCLERYPSHPRVVGNSVEFYEAQGEVERSVEVLRRAFAEAPTSRGYRSALVERLRVLEKQEEAEELLRKDTESEDPYAATLAWIDLAAHHQAVGNPEATAEASCRAAELARELEHPHLAQLLLACADALLLTGELDRALAVADDMTARAHGELVRARVAQERGQHAEALAHFEEASRLWPDNAFARYYAARAAEAVGDFDRAVEAYRYAIRIDPETTDARVRVARLHAAEGKPADALILLRTNVQRAPLDLDGELLSLRLWARVGENARVRRALAAIGDAAPDLLGRSAANAAEGVRARSGPAAAVRMLRSTDGIDFANPAHADALRALVRFSSEAGRAQDAEPELRAALRAQPDIAVVHEIRGLWLVRSGASEAEVRSAYERALELDPDNARAMAGLGLALLGADPERALMLLERASEADPGDAEAGRAAAAALRALGRPREAEVRLEGVLLDNPYDAATATALVEFRLERDAATEEPTLEFAQRAVRFGGGADALDLLSRVYRERDDEERATRAAARARALRERQAPDA
jgi:tetratricopeptide (TPR) repeat protein